LAEFYGIGVSTAHGIFKEVCRAIWSSLSPVYVKSPTEEKEFYDIAKGFENRWNLPHCVGAFDGKHIRIKSPKLSGSVHNNDTQFFSLFLFAVCDSEYCFTMVDIGVEGSKSDAGIFKESGLGKVISDKSLPLPAPQMLPNSQQLFPYYFIGDEAFALASNFMIPFGAKYVAGTSEQAIINKIYNHRLSRARRVTENAFGILASRWRIFHTTIQAEPETAELFVQACVSLHNFVMKTKDKCYNNPPPGYYGDEFGHIANDEPLVKGLWRSQSNIFEKVEVYSAHSYPENARKLRETLADYVNNCFTLSHQRDYVLKDVKKDEKGKVVREQEKLVI